MKITNDYEKDYRLFSERQKKAFPQVKKSADGRIKYFEQKKLGEPDPNLDLTETPKPISSLLETAFKMAKAAMKRFDRDQGLKTTKPMPRERAYLIREVQEDEEESFGNALASYAGREFYNFISVNSPGKWLNWTDKMLPGTEAFQSALLSQTVTFVHELNHGAASRVFRIESPERELVGCGLHLTRQDKLFLTKGEIKELKDFVTDRLTNLWEEKLVKFLEGNSGKVLKEMDYQDFHIALDSVHPKWEELIDQSSGSRQLKIFQNGGLNSLASRKGLLRLILDHVPLGGSGIDFRLSKEELKANALPEKLQSPLQKMSLRPLGDTLGGGYRLSSVEDLLSSALSERAWPKDELQDDPALAEHAKIAYQRLEEKYKQECSEDLNWVLIDQKLDQTGEEGIRIALRKEFSEKEIKRVLKSLGLRKPNPLENMQRQELVDLHAELKWQREEKEKPNVSHVSLKKLAENPLKYREALSPMHDLLRRRVVVFGGADELLLRDHYNVTSFLLEGFPGKDEFFTIPVSFVFNPRSNERSKDLNEAITEVLAHWKMRQGESRISYLSKLHPAAVRNDNIAVAMFGLQGDSDNVKKSYREAHAYPYQSRKILDIAEALEKLDKKQGTALEKKFMGVLALCLQKGGIKDLRDFFLDNFGLRVTAGEILKLDFEKVLKKIEEQASIGS